MFSLFDLTKNINVEHRRNKLHEWDHEEDWGEDGGRKI